MALVGFDDFDWADSFSPRLTVMAQPCEQIGVRAARLLIQRLKDPDGKPRTRAPAPDLAAAQFLRLRLIWHFPSPCGEGQGGGLMAPPVLPPPLIPPRKGEGKINGRSGSLCVKFSAAHAPVLFQPQSMR